MHFLDIHAWRDNVRFLSFQHENTLITFTQIENETVLINQLPFDGPVDELIEIGQSVAKVKLYQLDNLPSLEISRKFISEQNRDFGHFLEMPIVH
jgi:hypothetical protein